jgi:hypothetical protein
VGFNNLLQMPKKKKKNSTTFSFCPKFQGNTNKLQKTIKYILNFFVANSLKMYRSSSILVFQSVPPYVQ